MKASAIGLLAVLGGCADAGGTKDAGTGNDGRVGNDARQDIAGGEGGSAGSGEAGTGGDSSAEAAGGKGGAGGGGATDDGKDAADDARGGADTAADGAGGKAGSFAARCADPAVIACFGFDTAAEVGKVLVDSGHSPPEFDPTMAADGTGSIHMRVLAGSGADTSGHASLDIPDIVGEGGSIYVQWRQRFSASFLATEFEAGGWKQILLHENTSTAGCSDSEVVVTSYYNAGFPVVYHCRQRGRREPLPAGSPDTRWPPAGVRAGSAEPRRPAHERGSAAPPVG